MEENLSETSVELALAELENHIQETQKNELAEIKEENDEISVDEVIFQEVMKGSKEVFKTSNEIYDLFYTPIALGKDRSDVSKQSLLDSQRLKIEAMNALTNYMNAKARLASSKNQPAGSKTGIIISTMSGKEAGINIANLE